MINWPERCQAPLIGMCLCVFSHAVFVICDTPQNSAKKRCFCTIIHGERTVRVLWRGGKKTNQCYIMLHSQPVLSPRASGDTFPIETVCENGSELVAQENKAPVPLPTGTRTVSHTSNLGFDR